MPKIKKIEIVLLGMTKTIMATRRAIDCWEHVLPWLRDNLVLVGTIDLILGKFDIANEFILVNHILLLGKFYIYSRRCLNSVPTLRGFIARTRRVYNIELHIAREKNKLLAHFQKWEKLINALLS